MSRFRRVPLTMPATALEPDSAGQVIFAQPVSLLNAGGQTAVLRGNESEILSAALWLTMWSHTRRAASVQRRTAMRVVSGRSFPAGHVRIATSDIS
eukprot:362713-Chlamydomonas_euryale.AAC.19